LRLIDHRLVRAAPLVARRVGDAVTIGDLHDGRCGTVGDKERRRVWKEAASLAVEHPQQRLHQRPRMHSPWRIARRMATDCDGPKRTPQVIHTRCLAHGMHVRGPPRVVRLVLCLAVVVEAAEIRSGKIKALVCLENDPASAQAQQLASVLGSLEFLLVMDYLPNRTAEQAHAFLPTTGWAESDGSYVNNEGRMLAFSAAFAPGLPIRETGGGDHPPRVFEAATPGSLPIAAWQLLAKLTGRDADLLSIHRELESTDARFAGLTLIAPEREGTRISGTGIRSPEENAHGNAPLATDELPLLVVDSMFGSERLASFSATLQQVAEQPRLLLHPDLAARLQLQDGDIVILQTEPVTLSLVLQTNPNMTNDLAIANRICGTALEHIAAGSLLPCRIEKGGDA
jgi:NADH-quinone oxidoreductase subunit G